MPKVGEAGNGLDGLAQCRELRPDIVFLDIIMPVMDGLTMFNYLREEQPQVYVVILTCHQDYPYMRKGMQLGAFDYILKVDIDNTELFRIMSNLNERIKYIWDNEDKTEINKILVQSASFQQWWRFGGRSISDYWRTG